MRQSNDFLFFKVIKQAQLTVYLHIYPQRRREKNWDSSRGHWNPSSVIFSCVSLSRWFNLSEPTSWSLMLIQKVILTKFIWKHCVICKEHQKYVSMIGSIVVLNFLLLLGMESIFKWIQSKVSFSKRKDRCNLCMQRRWMSCSNSLIVMVNFMCLTRLKDAQIAGKTYFLSVSVRVLLEEISIWIAGLSKEEYPHKMSRYHPIWGPE